MHVNTHCAALVKQNTGCAPVRPSQPRSTCLRVECTWLLHSHSNIIASGHRCKRIRLQLGAALSTCQCTQQLLMGAVSVLPPAAPSLHAPPQQTTSCTPPSPLPPCKHPPPSHLAHPCTHPTSSRHPTSRSGDGTLPASPHAPLHFLMHPRIPSCTPACMSPSSHLKGW